MKFAIVDVETGGTKPEVHQLLEVAVAVVDSHKGLLVNSWSTLVHDPDRQYGAEEIHNIPDGLTESTGAPTVQQVLSILPKRLASCEAVCAYNVEFDRQWLRTPELDAMQWFDAMDIEWPKRGADAKLSSVALALGLCPNGLHRAPHDVALLQKMFERSAELGFNVRAMIDQARAPRVTVQAILRYEENQKAKDAGFRWHPDSKTWRKRMLQKDANELPFKTALVES